MNKTISNLDELTASASLDNAFTIIDANNNTSSFKLSLTTLKQWCQDTFKSWLANFIDDDSQNITLAELQNKANTYKDNVNTKLKQRYGTDIKMQNWSNKLTFGRYANTISNNGLTTFNADDIGIYGYNTGEITVQVPTPETRGSVQIGSDTVYNTQSPKFKNSDVELRNIEIITGLTLDNSIVTTPDTLKIKSNTIIKLSNNSTLHLGYLNNYFIIDGTSSNGSITLTDSTLIVTRTSKNDTYGDGIGVYEDPNTTTKIPHFLLCNYSESAKCHQINLQGNSTFKITNCRYGLRIYGYENHTTTSKAYAISMNNCSGGNNTLILKEVYSVETSSTNLYVKLYYLDKTKYPYIKFTAATTSTSMYDITPDQLQYIEITTSNGTTTKYKNTGTEWSVVS